MSKAILVGSNEASFATSLPLGLNENSSLYFSFNFLYFSVSKSEFSIPPSCFLSYVFINFSSALFINLFKKAVSFSPDSPDI